VLLRLLALVRAPVELAEAEVAVGDEGAHAKVVGKRQRLAVRAFGGVAVLTGGRRDVTGEAECIGLAGPSLRPAGKRECRSSVAGRLGDPPGGEVDHPRGAAVVESSVATADAVLAALPGETAIIDSAGTIVQTNEAWATAARSGAAVQFALKVGANYVDACRNAIGMPPDIARKVYASIEAVLRGERDEFTLEYPTSRRGEDRWLEVRVRRLARLGGGAAVMHFDVTARRQAEAAAHRHLSQIAHLDRVASMGQLASSLAHELNQPLTAVLFNAQAAKRLLARAQPDLGELRACLADIISDDQRAGEVILRMRRLLKKTDFVGGPLALNGLVADTIGLVANEALLQAVTIEFSPAPALPVAYGDVVQVQQVILNLLTNAITAAANGGAPTRKVTVSDLRRHGAVRRARRARLGQGHRGS
jgi:signal transduction histidine kinase